MLGVQHCTFKGYKRCENQHKGNIIYKSIKIFAYADDIYIVGRSQGAMKEAFISLEKAA
jgi:hypothetical protein